MSSVALIDAAAGTHDRRWAVALGLAVAALALHVSGFGGLKPPETLIPIAVWITAITDWFTLHFRFFFRGISWLMTGPFDAARWLFNWLTWPSVLLIGTALGYSARGPRLATFCALALSYIVVAGYWDKTAVTLSMVAVAVPVSVLIGLFGGILAWRSATARRAISPVLDLMQTVPTFAYLVPILVLFGIGPVVGMIASAIYAVPPMVHNVKLGLQRTPPEVIESAQMSGSTGGQLLWWVMLPGAMRSILIGANQTVMAGLSMVVIASMVGGVDDIGIEVFQSMKRAKFGESLLSGLVIALLAIMMDRVSRGFAEKSLSSVARGPERGYWLAVFSGVLALQALSLILPPLANYPEGWVIQLAPNLNNAMQWFTVAAFSVTSAIKTWMVFVVLLPLKIGFAGSVQPTFWGFEMSPSIAAAFLTVALALVAVTLRLIGLRAAFFAASASTLYFSGTTGIVWPAMAGFLLFIAYSAGGIQNAVLAALGLLFILVTGSWTNAMISVQICIVGVGIAFLIGSTFGIWAALNDRVSAVLAPICDTLQTMPIFVFLIPAVMVFLVGEFTALVAIVMYSVVPSIRYAEHGIRGVPPEMIEAARMVGATRRQMLWQVQLPVAAPEIALGINQTIMMALAMVIVAALVGAQGLGSDVMVALSSADTGRGIVAGLCVALIAIIADRTLQAWARARKEALGLV